MADVGLELLPDGNLAYRQIAFTVPRQCGKTTLVLAVECHRALMWHNAQRIAYTAQTGLDAKKKLLDDQVPIIEKSKIKPLVKRVKRAAGEEAVIFANNSRIQLAAKSESSGHGKTIDLGIIDEAFADTDNRREQAMRPAMVTKRDGQVWVTSTAGTEESVYLKQVEQAGRAMASDGVTEGMAYFEWSAEPDADPGDEEVWWGCMPALGFTIDIETIRAEYRSFVAQNQLDEFRRAYLNQWTAAEERIIPAAMWAAVMSDNVTLGEQIYLGIDVSIDRSMASIVAVDSDLNCELIEHREGVNWLADRTEELSNRWEAPVVADERGPVAPIVPDLRARGLEVISYTSTEMAAACAGLYDRIADAGLRVRGPSDLDIAVSGATRRVSGEVWFWGRKNAHVDVSPLVALTLAVDFSLRRSRVVEPWAVFA